MSATPETDAAVIASGGDWSPVLRETCRRLERERDEEIKWHHRTHQELVETQCKLMDITRERDEAQEEAHKLSGAYEDATNYYARMIELIDQRDKLQEELNHSTQHFKK